MAYINGKETALFYLNGTPVAFIVEVKDTEIAILGFAILNQAILA